MSLTLGLTDLREAITRAVTDTASLRTAKQQECVLKLDAAPLTVVADGVRIRQILYNLLSNASKFTAEGGKICLAAVRTRAPLRRPADRAGDRARVSPQEVVWISVTDEGVGIRREDMPKLFQEFSQVDSSASRRVQGTGLGLALCKKFVEMHGGTIGADSSLRQGYRALVFAPGGRAHPPQALESERQAATLRGMGVLRSVARAWPRLITALLASVHLARQPQRLSRSPTLRSRPLPRRSSVLPGNPSLYRFTTRPPALSARRRHSLPMPASRRAPSHWTPGTSNWSCWRTTTHPPFLRVGQPGALPSSPRTPIGLSQRVDLTTRTSYDRRVYALPCSHGHSPRRILAGSSIQRSKSGQYPGRLAEPSALGIIRADRLAGSRIMPGRGRTSGSRSLGRSHDRHSGGAGPVTGAEACRAAPGALCAGCDTRGRHRLRLRIPPTILRRSGPPRRRQLGRPAAEDKRTRPSRNRRSRLQPSRALGEPISSTPRSARPGTSGSWPGRASSETTAWRASSRSRCSRPSIPTPAPRSSSAFEDEEVGVEEGYIYWTGLPGRLRVDVGKFRQQVGDLNRWHLHALPETEYPLVYQRYPRRRGLERGRALALHRAAGLARRRHPRDLGAGHHRRERPAVRRRPSAQRCSGGCRTSGSSAAAPTPRSASPGSAATTTTAISGAGLRASTSASPSVRRRPAPGATSPSGPKAIASTPTRPASPPIATAPSWICSARAQPPLGLRRALRLGGGAARAR